MDSDGRIRLQQGAAPFNAAMLAVLNCIGLVLSIPILAVGFSMYSKFDTYCITFLERPLIFIGLLLAGVSIAGLVAALTRNECLIWIHLGCLFLVAALIFCFAIFIAVVTTGGSGRSVPGKNHDEYVLSDYSDWMRFRVQDNNRWSDAMDCLKRNGVCTTLLPYNGTDQVVYDRIAITSVQSGCCKPPEACRFQYIDATHWANPATPGANADCERWSNDELSLCYHCSSCEAGLLQATKDRWKKASVTMFAVLAVLIVLILGFLATDKGSPPPRPAQIRPQTRL